MSENVRGKKFTEDQKKAIVTALKADPRRDAKSIAEELGLGHTGVQRFIGRIRKTGELPAVEGDETPAHERKRIAAEDEVRTLKKRIKDIQRAHIDDEAILAVLGVISDAPVKPPKWLFEIAPGTKGPKEVPVAMWSDFHYGEVVNLEETGGVNQYNMEIADKRIELLVERTISLCKRHRPDGYSGIVINLLGDFVSGALHPELAKTDEEDVIACTLRMRDILITCLDKIVEHFGRVYVPCTPGNHGRNTMKPEFKGYYSKNFDWLIYQLLRRHYDGDDRIIIDVKPSNEIHYKVYGVRFLAMHGDMLGVKGGDGIIGAIGPIMRGEVKTRGQAFSVGSDYDVLLMGHWHQPLWLPRAIVNNALKGFDEYAKHKLRAVPTSPSQMLFFVHPQRGITSRWEIKLDEPIKTHKDWLAVPAAE